MRKVTAEEIKRLYEFTRKHYVEYYDVQTELVDHLASAMDENWEKEPELGFEENLQREFKNFGVFGFMEVVEKKSRALEKRYFFLVWRVIKQQLGNLRILAFFLLTFSVILLMLRYGNPYVIAASAFLFFGILLYLMLKSSGELKRKKKKGEKIYLLETFILNTGVYFSLSYVPLQVLYHSGLDFSELWVQLLTALICTFLIFSLFVCFYLLPGKKEQLLREQYPEWKF